MGPRLPDIRNDGTYNWDLSVFKDFHPVERLKIQFRAEALNAFNTPRFSGPNTSVTSSTFGVITSQGQRAAPDPVRIEGNVLVGGNAGLCLLMLALAGLPAGAQTTPAYRVTPRAIVEKPVSPLLASHFVELGYGYQVEPMMAEMLFNRSFEPYMPYRDNSFTWFGLWFNNADQSKGYETDWTRMHWYHSGYEHNAWFAAPAEEPPFHIDQRSTFFVPDARIELTREKTDVRHGRQALRFNNRNAREWAALAQGGKYLRKGETYTFRGVIKSNGGPGRAEVRFYPRGKWERPIAVLPLKDLGPQYAEKSATFRNPNYQGYATFSLWIAPGASVTVDDFSLLPASSFRGWRNDVVDAIKGLKPGLFRFPGGCFASFYDWRDGVGPALAPPAGGLLFLGRHEL